MNTVKLLSVLLCGLLQRCALKICLSCGTKWRAFVHLIASIILFLQTGMFCHNNLPILIFPINWRTQIMVICA